MKQHQIECPYCGRQHGSKFSMRLFRPENMQCLRCGRAFEVERCDNDMYIMREKPPECEYTPEIVCPYCGHEYQDSWELSNDMADGEEGEFECYTCEKVFCYMVHYATTYTTRKPDVA